MDPKNASMHMSHVVSRRGEKEYHSYLVRRSYREEGTVKHETVANVSKLPPAAIEALSLALSKKPVVEAGSDFEIISSKRHGAALRFGKELSSHRCTGQELQREKPGYSNDDSPGPFPFFKTRSCQLHFRVHPG